MILFCIILNEKWLNAMHETEGLFFFFSLPVTDDVGDLKTLIDSILVSHFSDVLIMFVLSSVLVSITCDVMSAINELKLNTFF